MIFVYCKTVDDPKTVGEYICKSNFNSKGSKDSQVLKDSVEEDCWLIESSSQTEMSGMIYRIGDEIVGVEIDEDCAVNVVEPLMKKYGFDKVKWLSIK